MGGYVPTGVMVSHKVLLTPESPQDVADAVLACKVGPDGSEALGKNTLTLYGSCASCDARGES